MYVPEIHKQRKKISGLKMPRQYTPRLPGASTKGQAPVNPFLGNKMKLASLSSFREAQLLKVASQEDLQIYDEMRKLAECDPLRVRMFLAQYPEMEKDAGIVGHGFRLLSKALGKGGAMTGSSKMTQMAGQAAKKSSRSFQQAATKAQGRVVSMEEGLRKGSGGRLVGEMGKADRYAALGKQQGQWAKTHGQTAGKQIATRRAGVQAAAEGATPLVGSSTLGKAMVGTAALGGMGVVGYGAAKGHSKGQAQNMQAQQRGFNYGI